MASEMTIRFELFVGDRDRSVDFYTSVLGFEVQRLDESHALLTCGQVTLGLGRQADLPETGDGPGFTRQRLADRRPDAGPPVGPARLPRHRSRRLLPAHHHPDDRWGPR